VNVENIIIVKTEQIDVVPKLNPPNVIVGIVKIKMNIFNNDVLSKVFGSLETHEDAVASARASLRSEHKHRFNRKFLCLSADGFLPSEFSQIGFADFVKPNIYADFQTASSASVNQKPLCSKLNLILPVRNNNNAQYRIKSHY